LSKIALGEPDRTWEKYGLLVSPVSWNQGETKLKVIEKHGALVEIVKSRYKLIPNELVVEEANKASALAGLVPFDQFSGDWIQRFNKDETHVIKDKWKVHALYADEVPYTVKTKYGTEDEMYMGVAVHNSIDRSMGFSAGIFTFRKACRNVVLSAGMKGWSYDYSRGDHGKTLETLYQKHTKGMEILSQQLMETLITLMERSQIIKDTYNDMAQRNINLKIMENIRKSPIPQKLYPSYIPIPKVDITRVPDKTQWEMYNDFTEAIWHNPKATMNSKLIQFKHLHKVLPFEDAPNV